MQRRYVTVDVFTDRAFGGNPLAVILDAAGLSTAQMQAIASEFNYSETTFVLPPQNSAHDAQVRIFTVREEIPFAGRTAGRGAGPEQIPRGQKLTRTRRADPARSTTPSSLHGMPACAPACGASHAHRLTNRPKAQACITKFWRNRPLTVVTAPRPDSSAAAAASPAVRWHWPRWPC